MDKGFLPYILARLNNRRKTNVQILKKDFFKENLGNATHIYTYLFPEPMDKLYEKFKAELKPGTSVISRRLQIGKNGTQPNHIYQQISGVWGRTIYLYKF